MMEVFLVVLSFATGAVVAITFYFQEIAVGIAVRKYTRGVIDTFEERADIIEKLTVEKAHEIADKL